MKRIPTKVKQFNLFVTTKIIAGITIAYIMVAVAVVVTLKNTYDIRASSHTADRKLCQLAINNRNALRALLVTAERNSVSSLKNNPERLKQTIESYRKLLIIIPPIVCKGVK